MSLKTSLRNLKLVTTDLQNYGIVSQKAWCCFGLGAIDDVHDQGLNFRRFVIVGFPCHNT